MTATTGHLVAAVVQATPVFLDRDATIEKACGLIREAGRSGAGLVVFPESFIPTYPDWVWAVTAGETHLLGDLYAEFLAQSVNVDGPEIRPLAQAARDAGVYVVMGISERNSEASGASLYNSLLYLNPRGEVMGRHRKLVPTGAERLVWAQGDGSTLNVFDTSFGRLSGLICWENYMPLARYSLYAWGAQIYAAPTWDRGEPWLSTIRHIAAEGRVCVLSTCIALRKSDIPARLGLERFYAWLEDEWVNPGDSAIVAPNGSFLAGPLHGQEGILYAELDLSKLAGPKWMLDVAGHYARPDVFELKVNRRPRPVISAAEGE
jgi:nitrilase